jgi:hypothetical protein
MKCHSCGQELGTYLPELGCIAWETPIGQTHRGRCWKGQAPDDAQRKELVDALVRASEKRKDDDDGIPF